MQLTLLPLHVAARGLGNFEIGLCASFYFGGFAAGCFVVPQVISRVGHIRSFAVLASIMAGAILILEMVDALVVWLGLRFVTGAAICGLYSVIESWLNDQSSTDVRGRVLAVYTFVVLAAMIAGQILLGLAASTSALPFTVAVLFIVLSTIPVGLTRALAPARLESARLRLGLLAKRSPEAFAGGLLAGLVTGAFWSLGAVFAQESSGSISAATWFMSAAIAGGAGVQLPLAILSPRYDRRHLLAGLSVAGMATSVGVATSVGGPWLLIAACLFGGATLPLYATSLTIAADGSAREEFVEVGTTVLLLNALGSMLSPIAFGPLMTSLGASYLFWASAAVCGVFAVYFLARIHRTARAVVGEPVPFIAAAESVPTGFDLDPRAPEDVTGDLGPAG